MAARTYVCDIAGGTATATIQIQGRQTLKRIDCSWINAAAGKIEVSRIGTSQIGTAQPTGDVIARFSVGSSGQTFAQMDVSEPVTAFQSIYVHCTGAGNLGTVVLS